jgi:hypothetical protein
MERASRGQFQATIQAYKPTEVVTNTNEGAWALNLIWYDVTVLKDGKKKWIFYIVLL